MKSEIFQGQDFKLNFEEEWKMRFFCENFLFNSTERMISNVSSLNTTQRLAYEDLVKGVWLKSVSYLPQNSIDILTSVYKFGKTVIEAESEFSDPINDTFLKSIKIIYGSSAYSLIKFLFKVFDEKFEISTSFMFEIGSVVPANSLNLLIKYKRLVLNSKIPVVKRIITSRTLIEDLSISNSLKSRLISQGYITVFDIQKDSVDGLKIKGIGPKGISEIEKELFSFLN